MYISSRAAFIRNISVSLVNGSITLIILLIAPLGLMAVIINTLLVTAATYVVSIGVDQVVAFLNRDQQAELLSNSRRSQLRYRNTSEMQRRQ